MKPITEKLEFLQAAMADPRLTAPAKCVLAVLLLKHHHTDTGRCNPGLTRIAKGVGRDRRNVIRAVEELRQSGWVEVISTKGGPQSDSNKYKFDFSYRPTSGDNATGGEDDTGRTGDEVDTGTGGEDATAGVAENVATSGENAPRTFPNPSSPRRGEREGEAAPPRAPDGARQEEAFAQLWALWTRPYADEPEPARRAFVAACRDHEPADILAGAQAWVAVVEPSYLPALAKWLRAESWCKPPPKRRASDGGGGGGRRGKVNPVEAALRAGGFDVGGGDA